MTRKRKAANAGLRFFFTWNVNDFVLWDRSLWDRPLLERRVWERRLPRTLATPADVAREDNLEFIKTHFLPDLLRDLADIISGRRRDWAMPPDDIFIRSLESHLDWPVQLAGEYIAQRADRNKAFDLRVEQRLDGRQDWTFVRSPQEEWAKAVDNMAKTLAYVWANRLIFYKALRSRFPDLPRLGAAQSIKKPEDALAAFNRFFQQAVERSGDYEPLLMPEAKDWATELVFHPPSALDAWRGLLRGIESVDFREVPSDVVGRIFQKLIGPDERHRYGQHFTGDDVVDLINAFCIRNAGDAVLDPACGSGSFLVRAYYRKRHLDPARLAPGPDRRAVRLRHRPVPGAPGDAEPGGPRDQRRGQLPAHRPAQLLRLRPARAVLPDSRRRAAGSSAVPLPQLDAVVGNPPYVRQEKVDKTDKARFGQIAADAWPGLRLTRAQRPALLLLAGRGAAAEARRLLRLPDQFVLAGCRVRLCPSRLDAAPLPHPGHHGERGRAVVRRRPRQDLRHDPSTLRR